MTGLSRRDRVAEWVERDGINCEVTLPRRTFLLATAAAAGGAVLGHAPAYAQQATPVASPVATARDWRDELWVGSWAAAPHVPGLGFEDILPSQLFTFDDQTVRQIVRISAGGDRVRVRLSNVFGEEPLVVGAAHIAMRDGDARIDAASDRELTFSGQPAISIPPGALALSDPVDIAVSPLAELAISLYLPQPTTGTTVHGTALQTNYSSPAGNFTAEIDPPVDETFQTWVFLSGVDVAGTTPTGAVAVLGDSITDGVGSTPDTNQRWTDILAERLVAEQAPMAVLNEGIGGNRVLHDSPPDLGMGPSALARFDRDVLAQPVVTHLIVLLGTNDIVLPIGFGINDEIVSAAEIIAGLRQLVERAHERRIVVFGVPMAPFGESFVFTPEAESMRQEVNTWIRTSGAYDAVLDFEAVWSDPANPSRLLPAFDSGDHVHPNDAGYQAMVESIDLSLFQTSGAG
jgi:lysophospholipase L1-like esterase